MHRPAAKPASFRASFRPMAPETPRRSSSLVVYGLQQSFETQKAEGGDGSCVLYPTVADHLLDLGQRECSRWKIQRSCKRHLNGQPDDSLGQFARKQHAVVTACCSVVLRALRVKCLTLRNAEPRGPNGKPPDPTSAGADALLGARRRWYLSRDQRAEAMRRGTTPSDPGGSRDGPAGPPFPRRCW